jgi:hypothetical protein
MNDHGRDDSNNERDFITFIHNYCDHWCERCAFTDRCMSYAFERELPDDAARRDEHSVILTQEIRLAVDAILNSTNIDDVSDYDKEVELPDGTCTDDDSSLLDAELEEILGLHGHDWVIDDEEFEAIEEALADQRDLNARARRHPLVAMAECYMNDCRDWFVARALDPLPTQQHFEARCSQGFLPGNAREHYARLLGCIEIVTRYYGLLHVKLERAMTGALSEQLVVNEDMYGSLKLSLQLLDRSIAAWTELHALIPEHETFIVSALRQLNGMRSLLEHHWPEARAYKRPGLDDDDSPNSTWN